METQYISLNMTPTGVNPCFHISQYDVGRMLGFIVHSGGATVDLDTYTCTVEATRSDGTAITSAVATTDNIGTFEVTPTMSNKADKYRCQLVIVDANSKRIASLPFDMEVTKAAMDENSEAIEEDASLYQQYTEAVQGAIAEANADIQAEENARIAAVNAEATARQNADATLQNNIDAEATARQSADNTLQGNINSEAATRASADSNLQSQINQIVAPSGEAPSAAEVQNARIGADGVTYDTLGNAIRGQVSVLKSDSDQMRSYIFASTYSKDKSSTEIQLGGFTYSTGSATTNIKRCRTKYDAPIKNDIVALYINDPTYKISILGYNIDGSYIGYAEPVETACKGLFYVPSAYPYFKLMFIRSDSADMTSADYDAVANNLVLLSSKLDDTLNVDGLPANSKSVGDKIKSLLNQNNLLQSGVFKENYFYRGYEQSSTDYSYFIIPVETGKTYVLGTKCRFLSDADNLISQNLNAGASYTATFTGNLYLTFYNEDRAGWKTYLNTVSETEVPSYDTEEIKTNTVQASVLNNKVWYACGDSFTQGDFTGYSGQYRFNDSPYFGELMVYPYFIGRRTNAIIKNLAVGGMTMAEVSGSTNDFIHVYQNVGADADYITLKFGINDGHRSVPIGTIDSTDTSTFYGAWNTVMSWLIANRPTAKIGIIVSNGLDADRYADATIAIAKKYGVPYLNEWSGEQVPLMLRSGRTDVDTSIKAIRDETFRVSETNQHPNPISHEYESTIVEAWLKTL